MTSLYSQEEDFLQLLINAKDVKGKLAASNYFISYPANPSSNMRSADLMKIIDSVIPWIRGCNFKVSLAGFDVLLQMCDRMSSDFRVFVPVVLPVIIDRLGDKKDAIRERCQLLISKMIEKKLVTPQSVLEKMIPCFTNRNTYIRAEVLHSLSSAIDKFGRENVNATKFLPFVAKLLTDSNLSIREDAVKCLLTIYRHIGDEMKVFLLKDVSVSIPSQKLDEILKKLDRIKLNNELLPSVVALEQNPDSMIVEELYMGDKSDRHGLVNDMALDKSNKSVSSKFCITSLKSRQDFNDTSQQHAAISGSLKQPSISIVLSANLQSTYKSKKSSEGKRSGSSTSAGAVDEEYFIRAIDNTTKVQVLNVREIGIHVIKIKEIVGNVSMDWSKRVEALKKLRGIIAAGAENFSDFQAQVFQLESSIESAVKDLRSQVVREACITISFLAMKFQNKFECSAERILPHVIPLLMSAAKVVSSSGLICLQLVLRHIHSIRLVPTIISNLSSKSKEIRKAMCKLMYLIINTWPYQILKKCSVVLEDGIKKGIADADCEARDFSRKAFWAFQKYFSEQAEDILKNIDPIYQRTLLTEAKESSMISCSSNTKLISESNVTTTQSFQPELNANESKASVSKNQFFPPFLRSQSAINFNVAHCLKSAARDGVYSQRKVSSETSLFQNRIVLPEKQIKFNSEQKCIALTRNQTARKSHPNGSSAFISSRKALFKLNLPSASKFSIADEPKFLMSVEYDKMKPVTSKLTNTELEISLNSSLQVESKFKRSNDKEVINISKLTPVSEQIFLQPDVETRSILSESLSNSYSESQQKNFKSSYGVKELNKIILNCGSTHWNDRKEGLINVQMYLKAGNLLKPLQLRRITGHFTKMFVDSHTEDFSLFLSTLDYVVVAHKFELNFWLYVLLARLLNKLRTDLVVSIYKKIHKTLDTVRESFSNDILMSAMLRFVNDTKQMPNSRVKIAACSYISKLGQGMDAELAILLASTDQFIFAMTSAVTKMVEWAIDYNTKKDSKLIKAAQEAVTALFNLDTSKGTLFLSRLPKECQKGAEELIQFGCNLLCTKNSVETRSNSSSSTVSPRFLQGRPIEWTGDVSDVSQKSLSIKSFRSESEAENSTNDYFSTPQNNAEIQHFGYRSITKNIFHEESPNFSPDKTNVRLIEPKKDSQVFKNQTNHFVNGRISTPINSNRIISKDFTYSDFRFSPGDATGFCSINETEALAKTLISLMPCDESGFSIDNCHLSNEEIKMSLTQLIQIVKNNKCVTIVDHFKKILRIIITQLDSSEFDVRSLVLSLLTEMINKKSFVDLFNDYVELLLLKIFKSIKKGNQDMIKKADACMTAVATLLSPDLVIRVLIPLIPGEDYPVNVSAIKSLTQLIETRGRDCVINYLEDIMPILIQAYENEESSVRKSSVFCIVALHVCLGEEMLKPYLTSLCGSKLKLLQIYINRAEGPLVS